MTYTSTTHQIGLRSQNFKEQKCYRCDYPLKLSQHEGKSLVFSRSMKKNTNIICINCATKTNKVTIKDIDDYLSNKIDRYLNPNECVTIFLKRVFD